MWEYLASISFTPCYKCDHLQEAFSYHLSTLAPILPHHLVLLKKIVVHYWKDNKIIVFISVFLYWFMVSPVLMESSMRKERIHLFHPGLGTLQKLKCKRCCYCYFYV